MRESKKEILSDADLDNIVKSRVIQNNTVEIHYKDGSKAIRLHHTNIITTDSKGNITLNSGGWRTPTTKDRLNWTEGLRIYQDKGLWYVDNGKDIFSFYDGITFDKNHNLIPENKTIDMKEYNKVKRNIAKYVKLIDKVEELPKPQLSDCWYCCMRTEKGETLGDITAGDHLTSHLRENYLHGSILVNAMKERGYTDQQIGYHYQLNVREAFKLALRTYLNKRLLKTMQ